MADIVDPSLIGQVTNGRRLAERMKALNYFMEEFLYEDANGAGAAIGNALEDLVLDGRQAQELNVVSARKYAQFRNMVEAIKAVFDDPANAGHVAQFAIRDIEFVI